MTNGAYAAMAGAGAAVRRPPALALLIALVVMLIAAAFASTWRYGRMLEGAMLTLVLLAALFVVASSRRNLALAAILAIPALGGKLVHELAPARLPAWPYQVAAVLFVGFVFANILRFTLQARRVDAEVLSAAISNFLLLGLLWGLAYLLMDGLVPGSFTQDGVPVTRMDNFDALYFSFITLCTVGYGDIVPLSPAARVLSMLEAVAGLFYSTVLVARLVALYSSEPVRPRSNGR